MKTGPQWQASDMTVQIDGQTFRILTAGRDLVLYKKSESPIQPRDQMHTHFTYELFFAVSGSMTLFTDGAATLYQNSLIIVPPHVRHCSARHTEDCYCMLLRTKTPLPLNETDRPVSIPLSETLALYIRELAQEWDTDPVTAEHLAAVLIHKILQQLNGDNDPKQTNSSVIGIIDAYLNMNHKKDLTLKHLANIVHLCEKQVSRILKREYGATLPRILAKKRTDAAILLLTNTDLPVSAIAEQVSPTDPKYFFTVFKTQTGMTPLQYRKENRKSE